MSSRTATCSCGQLRATVSAEPIRVSVCHCWACQRRTGSAFGVQARFDAAAVSFSGESQEYLRVGDEGCHIRFRFCPDCGATVWYTLDEVPGAVAIPVGMFAEQDFPAPTVSVYEDRQHPWVALLGELKHMA